MVRGDERPEPHEAAGSPTLTLVVASEVRFVRESLGGLFDRGPAVSVIGYGADLDGTLRLCREGRPDLVLLDAALRDGAAAVRRLREALPGLRVVVFAVSESVESVLAWAQAGATGYIPSTAAATDMHALVVEIGAGRQTCPPLVAAGLLRHIASTTGTPTTGAAAAPSRPEGRLKVLTQRELEIVRLISAGLSNKEIARRLNIGVATTKSHVHNALGKLNVERRGQIAASWMHAGPPPA